jgi:malic enzyme
VNVPTDRRATVRLVIRGMTMTEARQLRLGGYLVIVLGEPSVEAWPGVYLEQGDQEAIVWTTPRQVDQVVANLLGLPGVVAARGLGD